MKDRIEHVVVVGGGSAGWLTATVIAADHGGVDGSDLKITVLEAPGIPPIGVGEGTWPSMRDTLRRVGVSETAFMRACDASFKQGSQFVGWRTGGDADVYFHPFTLPQGHGEANLVAAWLQHHAGVPFADLVSFQPHLCAQGRAPKQAGTPEFAAVANYAYHFDAGKFGAFLRQHGVQQLGIRHVADEVVGVQSHDNGDIAALHTREHGALAGDLFIDCTGLASLLLGRHYGVPLVPQQHVLFNDSALALQVPHAREDSPVAPVTLATARGCGWVWDIALPARRGVGLVYSSAHTAPDEAEAELRRYLAQAGGPADPPSPRRLQFTPGYRREFWHRNCVAVGLAAGFIEPLEASALALVEMSAAMISDKMPATREAMAIVARQFNDAFGYRWERVIDFLKLHYVLTRRTDTPYWRDHVRAESIPDRLRELLLLWRHQPPSRHDLYRVEEVFPAASYQYVLYGMGWRPEVAALQRRGDHPALADAHFREAARLTRRLLAALPDHRQLLQHVRDVGLPAS